MVELIIVILLCPILEIIATIIADKIENKVKWKPFEKCYNESLSKNKKSFLMVREPNSTIVLWFVIGMLVAYWLLGMITAIVLTYTQEASLLEGVIMVITFTVLCFPCVSICLHYVTKKIFVTEEQIFIKSIFIKKKYDFKDVTDVKENNLINNSRLEIKFKNKNLNISNGYSNYDLLKDILLK